MRAERASFDYALSQVHYMASYSVKYQLKARATNVALEITSPGRTRAHDDAGHARRPWFEAGVKVGGRTGADDPLLIQRAGELAVEITNALFELAGTRSALDRLNWHWRNARTHTLHDPVRWKLQHISRHLVHGTAPPRHGLI